MNKKIKTIIDHFQFEKLPVEGTFFKQTYKSSLTLDKNTPLSTAMIGMYCNTPSSFSCFHKLSQDETWHFYFGDALVLYLLHENGTAEKVVMGQDFEKGQVVQFTVPAGVWQAGCTIEEGEFSVFGCTLSPGFTSSCFEAGLYDNLINKFPTQKQLLEKFCIKGEENKMPEGF
jgi:predicted cupin superfamily sugar epimerase